MKPITKLEKIRKHLLSGKSLTPRQAVAKFDAWRLANVVHVLKKRFRLHIVTELIHKKSGVSFAKYYLKSVKQ